MADASNERAIASAEELPTAAEPRNHDDCVICLSAISERAVASPCNHCCFDFICLATWIQEQPRCPVCKADVFVIEYDWRSPTDYKTYQVAASSTRPTLKSQTQIVNRGRTNYRRHIDTPSAVDIALIRRRNVYRHGLYSLHIGSNRISGFRTVTPAMIVKSQSLQTRAKKWIRRELLVFDSIRQTGPSSPSRQWAAGRVNNAEHLLGQMIELLGVVDIRSEAMQDLLTSYIGVEHAVLFLHELSSWLRSPFEEIESWDRFVQYPMRNQTTQDR